MKRILQHNFQTKAHSLSNLFTDVHKMSTFMRRLETDALIDPLRYDTFKYLGDGFEFFVELFLYLHPTDNRVGVYNYIPIQENDNGCDGIGVNIKGDPCAVQIKYRTNVLTFLTANEDHLSNLISCATTKHRIFPTDEPNNYRYFVFTTAESLNFYTDQEMFNSKVKCFGYSDFRTMLDNNMIFWQSALEIVKEIEAINESKKTI